MPSEYSLSASRERVDTRGNGGLSTSTSRTDVRSHVPSAAAVAKAASSLGITRVVVAIARPADSRSQTDTTRPDAFLATSPVSTTSMPLSRADTSLASAGVILVSRGSFSSASTSSTRTLGMTCTLRDSASANSIALSSECSGMPLPVA